MRRVRTLLIGVAVLVGAVFAILAWQLRSAFPGSGSSPELATRVRGVLSGGSCVWIVPTDSGALLIDAGGDPSAASVVTALRALSIEPEHVQGILLTSGYPAHVAGAARFPEVPVYVGPGERALVMKERRFRSTLGSFSRFWTESAVPRSAGEVEAGGVLTLGGRTLRVIPLPGHTLGSTGYLLDDALVFTGDAVLARDGELETPPSWTHESANQASGAVARIAGLKGRTAADGHCRVLSIP